MALMKPDPTFYPSPKMAMQSPPERLAYVALINPKQQGKHDAASALWRHASRLPRPCGPLFLNASNLRLN